LDACHPDNQDRIAIYLGVKQYFIHTPPSDDRESNRLASIECN
jgi:hypothetical protein